MNNQKILTQNEFFHDSFFLLSALRFLHSHPEKIFHNHEFSELVIIVDGSATHCVADQKYKIKGGDVFIIHKGIVHKYSDFKKLDLINIIYDAGKLPIPSLDMKNFVFFEILFKKKSLLEPDDSKVMLHLDKEKLRQAIDLTEQIADQRNSWKPGSQFCSMAAFMQLIGLLSQWHHLKLNAKAPIYAISKTLNFISGNYHLKIGIDELAAVSGMSRRTLFRHFAEAIGMTPGHYLQQIRINHAAEMLRQTSRSINQIASSCGYGDSNYFSKQFRKIMDCSPRGYREK